MSRRVRRHWAEIALLAACPLLMGGDEASSARDRFAGLTPAQQFAIASNQSRFDQLDGDEKRRMRQLEQDLARDADSEPLRQVMHRYCRWFEALPAPTRFALAEMPLDERIEHIKKLKREEHDQQGLRAWLAARWERERPGKPGEEPHQRPRDGRDHRRPEVVREWFNASQRDRNAKRPTPTRQDIEALADLRGRLSKETAAQLEKQTPGEQWDWVRKQAQEEFWRLWQARIDRQLAGPQGDVSDQELATFFESLLAEQRESLLRLPGGEMRDRLRMRYQQEQQKRRLPDGPFPRQGPRPDGPPLEHLPGPPPNHPDGLLPR